MVLVMCVFVLNCLCAVLRNCYCEVRYTSKIACGVCGRECV